MSTYIFSAWTSRCTRCTLYLLLGARILTFFHAGTSQSRCTYIFPCRNFSVYVYLHFFLQELLGARVLTFFPAGTSGCTCTYIFPCRNFSVHVYLHFSLKELLCARILTFSLQELLCACVLTFSPRGTSRCTRCIWSPLRSSSTHSRHSCGTSTITNDSRVMALSNWQAPTKGLFTPSGSRSKIEKDECEYVTWSRMKFFQTFTVLTSIVWKIGWIQTSD